MSDNAILSDINLSNKVKRFGRFCVAQSAAADRIKVLGCAVKWSVVCASGGLRSMRGPACFRPICYSTALQHKIWWFDAVRNFPDQIRLRREDASQNMRRFYRMVVQRDLFGGASLIREWRRALGGRARSVSIITRMSGRTPPRLIAALLGWPLVTAPMAENLTGGRRNPAPVRSGSSRP